MPATTAGWKSAHPRLLAALGCDSLGACGTRRLFDAWSIGCVDADSSGFCGRAAHAAARDQRASPLAAASGAPWAYVEYDVTLGEAQLRGAWVWLPRDDVPVEGGPAPLRPFQLAQNTKILRAACAEFRLLSRLASLLVSFGNEDGALEEGRGPAQGIAPAADVAADAEREAASMDAAIEARRSELRGAVRLLTSKPPCLSCVGVVRQFQLLFPGVAISLAEGGGLSDAPTPPC